MMEDAIYEILPVVGFAAILSGVNVFGIISIIVKIEETHKNLSSRPSSSSFCGRKRGIPEFSCFSLFQVCSLLLYQKMT